MRIGNDAAGLYAFERMAEWRVSFLDGKALAASLVVKSEEKLIDWAQRSGALKRPAERQALEHASKVAEERYISKSLIRSSLFSSEDSLGLRSWREISDLGLMDWLDQKL